MEPSRSITVLHILLFLLLSLKAGPAKGEGTVFIHIHTFLLPTGCRPAAPGLPFTGPATRVCEVYFRVCLFPVSAHRPSGFICPPTSYTTQRFRHSRPDQQLSLSTSQPAHLPFKGAAQNQTILVEFWGQELRRVSSPPRRLGVFPLPVTSSNGDWSRNLHLTHKHPASLSLQWKVKCSHGYAPHGVCSRFCVSSQCVSCHPDGVPRCRDGCTSSSCLGNVTAKDTSAWTDWTAWSGCLEENQKMQNRTRTCTAPITHPATEQNTTKSALPCAGVGIETKPCTTICPPSTEASENADQICNINPCHNGGTCVFRQSPVNKSGCEPQYKCQCPPLHGGRRCEKLTPTDHSLHKEGSMVMRALLIGGLGTTALVIVGLACLCRRKCLACSKSSGKPQQTRKGKQRDWNIKRTIEIVHPHFEGRDPEGGLTNDLSPTKEENRVTNEYESTQGRAMVLINRQNVIADHKLMAVAKQLSSTPSVTTTTRDSGAMPPCSPAEVHHYSDLDKETGGSRQSHFTPPDTARPQWMLTKTSDRNHSNTTESSMRTPASKTTSLISGCQGYEPVDVGAQQYSQRGSSSTETESCVFALEHTDRPTAYPQLHQQLQNAVQSRQATSVSSTDRGSSSSANAREAINPLYNQEFFKGSTP